MGDLDEALVSKKEWAKVLAGDEKALHKMRADLNGVDLYCHMLSWDNDEDGEPEWVTLEQLHEADVIEMVTLTAYSRP